MNFRYVASHKASGERVSGMATATSVSELVGRLKVDGLLPIKVVESTKASSKQLSLRSFFRRGVKPKELAVFTRQLAATLSAGLLLTEALETIADDLENESFSRIIRAMKDDIKGGTDFSSALSKHPKIFPVTYVSIVRSGEATGNLHVTMKNLALYLENAQRLKEKVKNATRYPLFVFGFAWVVVAVIVLFLIPKFEDMFLTAGAQLPMLTRVVVTISKFSLKYAPILAVGVMAGVSLFIYCLRFPGFKFRVDQLKLRIPVIGPEIIHKSLISRFCSTLGFLFAGGVSLAKALDITAQVSNHRVMQQAVEDVKHKVISGSSLGDEIKKHPIFPHLAAKMIGVGEKTGKITDMLKRTADYYDEELDNALQKLTTLLEPALIIFIGSVVLIVVLALYLPIFNMATAIN